MAYNNIGVIYQEIRQVLLDLKFKEIKENFDVENIPDSLADNSFFISPFGFDLAGTVKTSDTTVIIGLSASIKLNLMMQLPANNIIEKLKTTMVKVENILKGILGIIVGEDEKDAIELVNIPEPTIENNKLIYELNFNLTYKIKNF